jgi:predicted transcriptional regulator
MPKGWKQLTPAVKRRIAKLTPTTSQHDIGILLGIHRSTVYQVQKKFGLTARPPRPSTRAILDLVDRGLSHAKTAKALGTTPSVVRYVAEKNGRRPGHHPRPISEEKMKAVMADICSGLYCGTEISRRNDLDYKKTLKLIHEVRQCSHFIGNTKIPLESYFPQKWPETKLGKKSDDAPRKVDDTGPSFIKLVAFLMARLKDEMPDDITQGARLLTGLCFRFVPRYTVNSLTPQQQDQAAEYFNTHILAAMQALHESENCAWKN